ncbi:MAG TPA: BatA domain-containing protein [Pirellulales bacterium]|nr:BatA domain-containing protein [Pirellulales bacterium]
MSLTFLTPLMLAGAILVAAPIVLHLVMRQVPKHLMFPALRFIRQRNDANKRRLKLRHLLLLALRCAAIVLLALALARPSLQSAGWLGDQEAPVAAALVFDTSPRMEYRLQNQNRLQVAQEAADKVMAKLPAESDVAIIDSRTASASFSIDPAAAKQRLGRLSINAAAQPLPSLCEEALRLVSESSKGRKEIYVFTDLGQAAWSADSAERLKHKLAEKTDVALYVVDVAVDNPQDFSLGDLRLSADTLAKNTPLHLETDLLVTGKEPSECSVALDMIDPGGNPQRREQISVTPLLEQPQPVEFQINQLEEGTHQGVVRLVGEDNLAADDARYFTVDVRPPWKVLVAAPKPADRHAVFLTEALAPETFRRTGQARFECDVIPTADLAAPNAPILDDYAAVCLLDPPPLTDAVWQALTTYVEHGGGLSIWLGRNAEPKKSSADSFNTPAAQKLMPGKLARIWRRQDAFLAPQDYQHPLLTKFRSVAGGVPWDAFTVYSHWQVTDLADGVNTVIPYSNGQAALLERSVGKGRVLVFTTPISDDATDPDLWNLLPLGSEPWPFVMLSNEMLLYLVGSGEERLNYQAGETVTLHVPEAERQLIFSLRAPDGEEFPQSVDQKTGLITVNSTNLAGNYLLRSGGTEGGVRRGFSVNVPAISTDLARLSNEDLTALLGKDRFRLSRGRDEIERDVNLGRTGRELYPLLIVLVAIVLGLEHLLANKFYRRDAQTEEATRRKAATTAVIAEETSHQHQPVEVA